MTYTITSTCISCDRCLSACPTNAIDTDGTTFWIDVQQCTQCQGAYSVPQCWAVCPTNDGCVPLTAGIGAVALTSASEAAVDYWESWFATYTRTVARLKNAKQSGYWQRWFDTYAQALQRLRARYSNTDEITLGAEL